MTPSEIHADERLVHVPLGERAYDILIGPGLIGRAGGEISARLRGRRAAIITDEHVAPLYLEGLMDGLQTDGIEAVSLTLPAGENFVGLFEGDPKVSDGQPVTLGFTREQVHLFDSAGKAVY